MDINVDVDVDVHSDPDVDNMTVVTKPENGRTWISNMQVTTNY